MSLALTPFPACGSAAPTALTIPLGAEAAGKWRCRGETPNESPPSFKEEQRAPLEQSLFKGPQMLPVSRRCWDDGVLIGAALEKSL